VGTSVLQLLSPAVVGFEENTSPDPPVVPPTFFFGIWAVITIGCVAAAAWGLPRSRAARTPYREVALPVSIVQLLFVLWLVLARAVPPLTVPVFAIMLALLVYALKGTVSSPADRTTGVLLTGSLGLYAGWAAGAVWLNLAAVLPPQVQNERALLAAALLAAGLTCVTGALYLNGTTGFVLGACWACAGICLSAFMTGAVGLAAIAAAGLLGTPTAGLLARRHRAA
jgi:hypothetical protein